MRWLCLDPGLKRTGVAISSPEGGFAIPLLVLEHGAEGPSLDEIASLMREHGAEGMVIGLPLSMDGTCSAQTREVLKFARRAASRLNASLQPPPDVVLPDTEADPSVLGTADGAEGDLVVVLWDERLTSWEAQRASSRVAVGRKRAAKPRNLDAHAASVILQSFLDARREDARIEGADAAGDEAEGGRD